MTRTLGEAFHLNGTDPFSTAKAERDVPLTQSQREQNRLQKAYDTNGIGDLVNLQRYLLRIDNLSSHNALFESIQKANPGLTDNAVLSRMSMKIASKLWNALKNSSVKISPNDDLVGAIIKTAAGEVSRYARYDRKLDISSEDLERNVREIMNPSSAADKGEPAAVEDPKPVDGSDSAAGTTGSEAGTTEPAAGASDSAAGTTGSEAGTTEPAAGTTEPAAGASEPAAGAPEPAAGASEPAAGAPEPAAGASEPAAGAPEPAAGASEPAAGASEPAAGASEPAAGDPEPTEDPKPVPPAEALEGVKPERQAEVLKSLQQDVAGKFNVSVGVKYVTSLGGLTPEERGLLDSLYGLSVKMANPSDTKIFDRLPARFRDGVPALLQSRPEEIEAKVKALVEKASRIRENPLQHLWSADDKTAVVAEIMKRVRNGSFSDSQGKRLAVLTANDNDLLDGLFGLSFKLNPFEDFSGLFDRFKENIDQLLLAGPAGVLEWLALAEQRRDDGLAAAAAKKKPQRRAGPVPPPR